MAIEVIFPIEEDTHEVTCEGCNCILRFSNNDINHENDETFIICPVCGTKITIE